MKQEIMTVGIKTISRRSFLHLDAMKELKVSTVKSKGGFRGDEPVAIDT